MKELISARDKCAQIITLYGEQYIPIFERLENEISCRQKRQELLNKAIRIATRKNGTQNGTQSGTHFYNRFTEEINLPSKFNGL